MPGYYLTLKPNEYIIVVVLVTQLCLILCIPMK